MDAKFIDDKCQLNERNDKYTMWLLDFFLPNLRLNVKSACKTLSRYLTWPIWKCIWECTYWTIEIHNSHISSYQNCWAKIQFDKNNTKAIEMHIGSILPEQTCTFACLRAISINRNNFQFNSDSNIISINVSHHFN